MSQPSTHARLTGASSLGLLLLLLVAQAVCFLTAPLGLLDDGIQVVGAMLVRLGQRPNIDFDSVYPPLGSYVLSAAFGLLGTSGVTYHLLQLLTAWVVVVATAAGVVSLTNRKRAALPVALLCLVLNAELPGLQSALALAFSLLATLAVLLADARSGLPRTALHVLAGALVACLLWTRVNFALYVLAAWAVEALARWSELRRGGAARPWLRDNACFAASLLVCFGLYVVGWGGSLLDLSRQVIFTLSRALVDHVVSPVGSGLSASSVRQLFTCGLPMALLPLAWIAVTTRAERGLLSRRVLCVVLALESVLLLAFGAWRPLWLPLLAAPPICVSALHLYRQRDVLREEAFVLLLLSLQTHYVLSRPDYPHFSATFPCLTLLLGLRLARTELRDTRALLLLTAAVMAFPGVYGWRNIAVRTKQSVVGLPAVPALVASDDALLFGACGPKCQPYVPDTDELAAASFIRRHTAAQERVYSGLRWHAGTVGNDMRLYWLMRRPPGTRAVMQLLGVTTQPERQEAIASELEQKRVRWAVLWSGGATEGPTQDAPLDRYIREKFRMQQRFGDYEVWRRL